MKKYRIGGLGLTVPACLILASLNVPVLADTLTIGAGTHYANTPYKKYNNHGEFMPVIMYDSDRFYIDDDVAGIYLVKNNTHEVDVGIGITDLEFNNDHANGAMKKLRDRKITAMASLNYQYKTNIGNFLRLLQLTYWTGITVSRQTPAMKPLSRSGGSVWPSVEGCSGKARITTNIISHQQGRIAIHRIIVLQSRKHSFPLHRRFGTVPSRKTGGYS